MVGKVLDCYFHYTRDYNVKESVNPCTKIRNEFTYVIVTRRWQIVSSNLHLNFVI